MTANHAHTPSLDQMRDLYVRHADQLGIASDHVLHAEFDRWYATIVSAAEQRGAEEGWDLAIDYAWDDSSIYEADAKRAKAANPYRADLLEGDNETH